MLKQIAYSAVVVSCLGFKGSIIAMEATKVASPAISLLPIGQQLLSSVKLLHNIGFRFIIPDPCFANDEVLIVRCQNGKLQKIMHPISSLPISTEEALKLNTFVSLLLTHSKDIYNVYQTPSKRAVIKKDGVMVWQLPTEACRMEQKGLAQVLQAIYGSNLLGSFPVACCFNPEGTLFASADRGFNVLIWDVKTHSIIKTLGGHESIIKGFAFSHDSSMLASASDDNTVRIWSIATGKCLDILQGHSASVNTVCFSHDGIFLFSGSDDKTIKIWDVIGKKCLHTLKEHTGPLFHLKLSPNGKLLASGSADWTLKIWLLG